MKKIKFIAAVLLVTLMLFSMGVTSLASSIKPYSENGKILTVSHGGNTEDFPSHSLEAVKSAFDCGADCVSVSVFMTSDEKLVLSPSEELTSISLDGLNKNIRSLTYAQVSSLHLNDKYGKMTKYTFASLENAIASAVSYGGVLIIDTSWSYRQIVYSIVSECDGLDNVCLKTNASKRDIKAYLSDTENEMTLMSSYHGNILFSARGFIKSMTKAGCSAVCLGTKNGYGVIFHKTVMSAFSSVKYNSRAYICTYNPDECGGRTDTVDTWSDVIDRGYSMIETDRIKELATYTKELYSAREALNTAVENAQTANFSGMSQNSLEQIESSIQNGKDVLQALSSLSAISNAQYKINLAFSQAEGITGTKVRKGTLSITPGRIIGFALVGGMLLVIQTFTYFKRADKRLPILKKRK